MFCLVVPCFNEAHRWDPGYWADMLQVPDVEWLFVDDGSSDGTHELAEALGQVGKTTVLSLQPNGGKGEAIRRGWLHALETGAFAAIGFMDADGAFNRADVEALIGEYREHVERGGYDATWSSRVALAGRNIQRHAWRHYVGRAVATGLSIGEDNIPYDTQSGLKLFRADDAFARTLTTPFETRWLFEIELMARYRAANSRPMAIWEMPLAYWVDVAGSKMTMRESMRVMRELMTAKRVQARSR